MLPTKPSICAVDGNICIRPIGLILERIARGLRFTVIPRYACVAFSRSDDIRVIDAAKPVIDTLS